MSAEEWVAVLSLFNKHDDDMFGARHQPLQYHHHTMSSTSSSGWRGGRQRTTVAVKLGGEISLQGY